MFVAKLVNVHGRLTIGKYAWGVDSGSGEITTVVGVNVGWRVLVAVGCVVAVGSNGVTVDSTVGATGVCVGVIVIDTDDVQNMPSGVTVQTGVGSGDCAPSTSGAKMHR